MKKHYKRIQTNIRFAFDGRPPNTRFGAHKIVCLDDNFQYQLEYSWLRHPKTTQLNRHHECFEDDLRHDEDISEVRRFISGRSEYARTAWDDINISRFEGRSWKDFTKKRRQWQE